MKAGIILLNFGEPETLTEAETVVFLERIFMTNAALEGELPADKVRARSRQLAERRAPALVEEYRAIGGSPLNRQAVVQAEMLADELTRRGHDVHTYVGMQFTDPSIATAVWRARGDGVRKLIGLPVYPLCGPSTTIAALDAVATAVRDQGWTVELHEVTGWHRHPAYTALRADAIRKCMHHAEIDLADGRTRLLFAAHGTPLKYLQAGSRYDRYVKDTCGRIAEALDVDDYVIGYQNHTNRQIPWTEPDIESIIQDAPAQPGAPVERVVVVPVSFMHEQSETLAELDLELKAAAEDVGLEFCRVPIPHDDARFGAMLADLVEPFLEDSDPTERGLLPCACRGLPRTYCLNGAERE